MNRLQLIEQIKLEYPELSGYFDGTHVLTSKKPPPGLLVSVAMRYDHSFGMPRFESATFSTGHDDRTRLSILSDMKKLHEEVVLEGFYSPEREDDYAEPYRNLFQEDDE